MYGHIVEEPSSDSQPQYLSSRLDDVSRNELGGNRNNIRSCAYQCEDIDLGFKLWNCYRNKLKLHRLKKCNYACADLYLYK